MDIGIEEIGIKAKASARKLAILSSSHKEGALMAMADELEKRAETLLAENQKDVEAAAQSGQSKAFIDRLRLTPQRVSAMAGGLRAVAGLPDPVGEVTRMRRRPNGLLIGKMRIPIGVIGAIYESRPNVTADVAALTLKSGNAAILRGGSEAINSNRAIADTLREVCGELGLPAHAIQLIPTTDRRAVEEMLRLDRYIDLIVPRGGEGLIRFISEHSRIPVLKHDKGLCHTYVDRWADLEMAERITINAKTQRPGVCNAMETMLVHREIAPKFLPSICRKLTDLGVEVRGCAETRRIVEGLKEATEEDWSTEYLDLILSVKVVGSLDEAIEHIDRYGSGLSEAIVTSDYRSGQEFLKRVDAAAVYVNASTRFTDGGEFGLGAEVGISTSRLHARGPVGLEELTTIKYIIYGDGQVRE
jgi:glutamate-5-semialdehyde dehydrogenase